MKSLKGKTVCITGGSGGVGNALATALAKEGCNLVLAARTEKELKKVADKVEKTTGQQVTICKTDISVPDQIRNLEKAVEEVGGVDILINAASGFSEDSLEDMPVEDTGYKFATGRADAAAGENGPPMPPGAPVGTARELDDFPTLFRWYPQEIRLGKNDTPDRELIQK